VDTDGEDHLADEDRYVFMHTVSAQAPIRPKTEQERFIEKITMDYPDNETPWDEA